MAVFPYEKLHVIGMKLCAQFIRMEYALSHNLCSWDSAAKLYRISNSVKKHMHEIMQQRIVTFALLVT
jgi:hypothetical protein